MPSLAATASVAAGVHPSWSSRVSPASSGVAACRAPESQESRTCASRSSRTWSRPAGLRPATKSWPSPGYQMLALARLPNPGLRPPTKCWPSPEYRIQGRARLPNAGPRPVTECWAPPGSQMKEISAWRARVPRHRLPDAGIAFIPRIGSCGQSQDEASVSRAGASTGTGTSGRACVREREQYHGRRRGDRGARVAVSSDRRVSVALCCYGATALVVTV